MWPSQAELHPGPSVLPDFTRPATRRWWGSLYQKLLDVGIAGIWNDMGEPSVFDQPDGTTPPNVMFDNEGQPASSLAVHNVYGQLMSRSPYEGLSRLRPDQRAFVLTRSSFAGGQRCAAVWTGDNTADGQAVLTGTGFPGLSHMVEATEALNTGFTPLGTVLARS